MSGLYKIKTVSERSGFSATLLRAWERRYGFLEPERQPSGHRLYTENDLRILRSVKVLLGRGQSIGEVAALGRPELLRMSNSPDQGGDTGDAAIQIPPVELEGDLRGLEEKLVACVADLEFDRARRLVESVFSGAFDWEKIRQFVIEVSRRVGVLWAEGKLSVASEHLLTSLWKEQLNALIRQAKPSAQDDRVIVCAGFPDEEHELGLLMLHYEWLRVGRGVVYLGPGLPFEDLDAVITRLKPHLVCLTVTRAPVMEMHLPRFGDLVQRHPASRFLVGGSGIIRTRKRLQQCGALVWTGEQTLAEFDKEHFGE